MISSIPRGPRDLICQMRRSLRKASDAMEKKRTEKENPADEKDSAGDTKRR